MLQMAKEPSYQIFKNLNLVESKMDILSSLL